ncbi:MAG: acyl-[acyl-carrier-protein] thioesterase [Bdellovibrionales bacterium]|nr:acyl-[acyl-carrier-protein] thioesterase [Bdellovibrionales bacterium]
MQPIWTENYKITSYLVNLRGRAGLYSILNFIQDVGWVHAFHLKIELERHQAWVFTRQRITMSDWPAWNQTLTIRTWVRPPQDRFLLRDYELFLGDKKIGECTSTFTVMDMNTRKLSEVDWTRFSDLWRRDHALSTIPQKIPILGAGHRLSEFQVRNSDLDMNQHVNNTKYAQWILDALPLELLKGGLHLSEYEVNFLAEVKMGDSVSIQQMTQSHADGASTLTQFQGIRVGDQKSVFTARMTYR